MIKIGLVNIDTSHPKTFAEYLNNGDRARYTAIYNEGFRSDANVDTFMKNYAIAKRFSNLKELVDEVDIGFIQGCNWEKHLDHAIPFIQEGKPVFIDKPLVGSVADCKRVEKMVEEGAVILGSSSVRYAEEIQEFIKQSEEERGKILSIHGTCGVDEFNYGIHISEAICEISQDEPKSVQFLGDAVRDEYSCGTYFVRFNNGITATFNLFIRKWQPFDLIIMTTKGTFYFRIDITKIYSALLDKICDFMETGKNTMAPIYKINQSIKVLIAGQLSRKNNCKTIMINEIPEDDPGFDGNKFEEYYRATAPDIYSK